MGGGGGIKRGEGQVKGIDYFKIYHNSTHFGMAHKYDRNNST